MGDREPARHLVDFIKHTVAEAWIDRDAIPRGDRGNRASWVFAVGSLAFCRLGDYQTPAYILASPFSSFAQKRAG